MKDFTPHINPNRACNAAAKGGILPLLGAFTEGNLGGLQLTGERIAAPPPPWRFSFWPFVRRSASIDGRTVWASFGMAVSS